MIDWFDLISVTIKEINIQENYAYTKLPGIYTCKKTCKILSKYKKNNVANYNELNECQQIEFITISDFFSYE